MFFYLRPQESDYAIHKLIIGTHTSEKEPNYLMIAKVYLSFKFIKI